MINNYTDLEVWQLAMDASVCCYNVTQCLPKEERYGLTSQIRRSSVSVPANIAEGWGRQSSQDYIRFLRIAQGSVKETETLLMLAVRVGFIGNDQIKQPMELYDSVGRMLRSLTTSIQNNKGRVR